MDRIFSIVPDRCQILLYEKHGLCFVTAVFEICHAYVTAVAKLIYRRVGILDVLPQCEKSLIHRNYTESYGH